MICWRYVVPHTLLSLTSVIITVVSRMRSPCVFATAKRFMSIRVKNSGSTARDHLANERTFLAWSKTGLGFLGAGTGIFTAYSFNYTGESHSTAIHPWKIIPAVVLLMANGGGLLAYATYRYSTVANALCAGDFIINKTGIYTVVASTSISTITALGSIAYEEYKVKGCALAICQSLDSQFRTS